MRMTRTGGSWPTREPWVTRTFIGYVFHIEYATPQYSALVDRRHGWRPTEKWAAKVAIRRHERHKTNERAFRRDVDAYSVLERYTFEQTVKDITQDLKQTERELRGEQ